MSQAEKVIFDVTTVFEALLAFMALIFAMIVAVKRSGERPMVFIAIFCFIFVFIEAIKFLSLYTTITLFTRYPIVSNLLYIAALIFLIWGLVESSNIKFDRDDGGGNI